MSDNIKGILSGRPNVNDVLGIELVSASPEQVVMRVEVGPAVHQPFGILHGGVSALLAEGAASVGGAVSVGPDEIVVGTELNCSHLRSMTDGVLTAVATPIRKGRRVHVWGIELRDGNERLICVARCTLQVLPAPSPASS
ncbi:MAG TPA: PaaI family thioesterase [Acidimicrobiales bacterium]|nr:PaaI family thioesterase [Acidimicrobiales bacterium]